MKVVNISFPYDETVLTEEQLLQQQYTSAGWAEALHKKGIEIIVLKRFNKESSFLKNGIRHYFIKDRLPGHLRAWQLPFRFLKKISSLDADIVHVHGLVFPFQTFVLRFLLKKKTAIIIQYQGGKPAKGIKSIIYRLMNSVADGFFFTTAQQAKEWFHQNKQLSKVMPIMEGATSFTYENRDIARKKTGIKGNPVFLWVGRLDSNKDPLTVLNGIETLLKKYVSASLYLIYSEDNLLVEVEKKIAESDILKNKVHLLGKVPHAAVEAYYNSADYFLLGSHYEGSGYALSEALACGCVPIVTDISSFRMMTDNGKLGNLWETGNAKALVEAAITALSKPLQTESTACIRFFNKQLSFDAIAEKAIAYYQAVVQARLKKKNGE